MSARGIRKFSFAIVIWVCCSLPVAQAAKAKAKEKATSSPPPSTALANVETQSSDFPPAELTLGFQTRESETEGIGDLLIPVWNPGGTGLLFVNPRSAMTDHDGEEYNFGIGYRQLLPKQKIIVGANAFYDYRDTGYSTYDQWGVGFELLSSWIDARINYYDPNDKKMVVGTQTEIETSQSEKTTSGWNDPYADNHAVVQDFTVTRTLTTLTTTRTYEQYEQALGGYDWEIGLRLPLPVKQETLEARVFGGAYDFNRDFGDDAQGWKARAELRVLSSLFLDAGVYENDDLTGSDWFAGARLSVPLDLAKISQGRNPFATAKSRLNAESRDFSARLTEMVMRDPQIRLETSKFMENPDLTTEDTSRTKTTQRKSYTLLGDVQFVDGDVSSSGDGTGQRPYATIQQGADNVFGDSNVYVYNASGAYQENVVLSAGTTLWGSGVLIPGMNGKTFGSGIAPVVDGMSMGPSITMANRTTVKGFRVQNTDMGGPAQWVMTPFTHDISRVGVYGDGATDLTFLDNLVSGNTVGIQLLQSGDFNLRFQDNRVTANEGSGMEVWGNGGGSGSFNADITRSLFSLNGADPLLGTDGLLLNANGYDSSVVRVQDSQFLDNAGNGLSLTQSDSSFAMALLSGLQAERNDRGLFSHQTANQISLVNISGSTANDNISGGILNDQQSAEISVGVIGMPNGLDTLAGGLASLLGFPLPAEVDLFLAPSGPVTANGNGGFGVQSMVISDGSLALGGLFDITANNNGSGGIFSINQAPTGIAVGLAGSTENLADIFNLGSEVTGLFGLDLPLSIPGGGQMQANGNAGIGFMMQTFGGQAAINAIVGLETVGNVTGAGTVSFNASDNLAVNAVARLNTTDNGGAGLLMDVQGTDTAAIGLIADVNASGNGDSGITASVDSPNGFAALLSLSIDALRPVAPMLGELFLGAPFEISGNSFGPVIASGNTGNGFTANVTGRDGPLGVGALALFLDTWADDNTGNGFDITVVSTNGLSIAAIISSDVVLNLLNDMAVLPDPIVFDPIGYVSASGNGVNGILLNQSGASGAYSLLTGIRADDNTANGINASLDSSGGDVYAILVDADADGNGAAGVRLDLDAYGHAISALVFADANDNAGQGFNVTQTSTTGDALALVSGSGAWRNGGAGMVYNLTATNGYAVACVTDSTSGRNGSRGGVFTLNAGKDAALLVGTNALFLFDLDYTGALGGDILHTFWDVLPQGESYFMNNGAAGLYADLTSTGGDVVLDIDGAYAGSNTNAGFNITLNALAGNISGLIQQTETIGNGKDGITLNLNGAGGTNTFWLNQIRTTDNGANGINVVENYNGTVNIGGERIVSTNNTANGVRIVVSGLGGVPALDFGGGTLGSLGQSSIYGNGNKDFRYNNGGGTPVMAENNWWGVAPPAAGQFAGSIDWAPWLLTDPDP